jgi:hypothetical protein
VAKYGNFVYGGATYGETPRLAYSVEPMAITVINFNETYVSWQQPSGTFTKIRLVRNENGYSETPEDGVTVWEQISADGSSLEGVLSRLSFIDGKDLPLPASPIVGGRQIYYSMFLFTDAKVWVLAGKTTDVVPSNHNTTDKLINLLPKVFTTDIQSPLGVPSTTSPLHSFLDGMGFTIDQFLTRLELLRPQGSWEKFPSSLILLQSKMLGLNSEPSLPTKNQKMLAREALFLYENKGTKSGLQTYVEALTGYAPTITTSSNLLLTVQDSTFYQSVGNWVATGATISSSTDQVAATSANQVDTQYTCKIVASAAGSIKLGANDPIRKGVPVNPSTQYTASVSIKSPTSAGSITLSIQFFDLYGNSTSAAHASTVTAANNTWKSVSVTSTSDAKSSYAVLTIAYSAAGTYYVDQVNVQTGSSVSYSEARAINIVLNPNKVNLIPNPSFEVDYANWTITGSPTISRNANVNTDTYAGSNSLKIINTAPYTMKTASISASTYGISVDQYYTASAYLQMPQASTMKLVAAASDGTILASKSVPVGGSNSWQRYSVTLLIDEMLTTLDHLYLEIDVTASQTAYYDNFQLELGPNATEYFDGSLPSQFGAIWAGTAHESVSYLYLNKAFKVPRLAETLADWTPANSFWRLSTLAGLEYNNLTV